MPIKNDCDDIRRIQAKRFIIEYSSKTPPLLSLEHGLKPALDLLERVPNTDENWLIMDLFHLTKNKDL